MELLGLSIRNLKNAYCVTTVSFCGHKYLRGIPACCNAWYDDRFLRPIGNLLGKDNQDYNPAWVQG